MIGTKLEDFINERFGKTLQDRERAAEALGTKTSTLYRWMSSGKHYVYKEGKSSVVIEINKKARAD